MGNTGMIDIGEDLAGKCSATTSIAPSDSRRGTGPSRTRESPTVAVIEHLLQLGVGDRGDEFEQGGQRVPNRADQFSVLLGQAPSDNRQSVTWHKMELFRYERSWRSAQPDELHTGARGAEAT